jgi:cytochrome c oxidase subunit 2
MIVPIAILLVILGSVAFHFWSPWWWSEVASNWGNIDSTIILTFWVTGVVFVAVGLFMAFCVWKYRYNKNRTADYEPENSRLEWILTILTALGVIALLTPGLIVWNKFVTVPDDVYEIEVLGYQWGWGFRLPGQDGILGTTDINNINDENMFGLNTDDPHSFDDILIDGDDLHILLNQPLKVNLRSLDVLHDFYVPQFRAKMDMIPGMITYYWFTPIKTGSFEILCAEYCGTAHYAMLGTVLVDEKADYDDWLNEQMTFKEILALNKNNDLIKVASKNDQ